MPTLSKLLLHKVKALSRLSQCFLCVESVGNVVKVEGQIAHWFQKGDGFAQTSLPVAVTPLGQLFEVEVVRAVNAGKRPESELGFAIGLSAKAPKPKMKDETRREKQDRIFQLVILCCQHVFLSMQQLGAPDEEVQPEASPSASLAPQTPHMPKVQICQGCESLVDEFAQNAQGLTLCRTCLRREDEELLSPSEEEQEGLEQLAKVLDNVSWKYWKPGEQPAKILDWMYLGDLKEATDFELLNDRHITAVLNLINWWELSSRLPEVADFSELYSSHDVEFLEDRLFFDIVEKCWPTCESFLKRCKARGKKVLVNCKAGHNRSACMCVCWLVACEGYGLLEAILSNHGFRLQLLRLALRLGRLGEIERSAGATKAGGLVKSGSNSQVKSIINETWQFENAHGSHAHGKMRMI
eukprot:s8_g19.t1